MVLEFLPVIGLIYINGLCLFYEFSIRKSVKKLEGRELFNKITKRLMRVAITIHVYGALFFLMRLAQYYYFNQRNGIYFLFDALMIFMLVLLLFFSNGTLKAMRKFEEIQ